MAMKNLGHAHCLIVLDSRSARIQNWWIDARCPNDRFPIPKQSLRAPPVNDRFWPWLCKNVSTGMVFPESPGACDEALCRGFGSQSEHAFP